MGFLRALFSFSQDPWAGVEGWRKRRELLVAPSKPTFDVYPDRIEQADMWMTLQARDAFGRVLTERVDLRGYSVNHINFEHRAWVTGLTKAVEDARKILRARLRLSAIHATKQRAERAEQRAQRAFDRAVAKEAREQAKASPNTPSSSR